MTTLSVREAAKALRAAQRAYMTLRNSGDHTANTRAREAAGAAVAVAAERLDAALAVTEVSTGDINRATAHYIAALPRGRAMEAALQAINFPALKAAAMRLYMAGRWSCSHPVNEVQLWEDLRDALGLEPGTATAAGVHDDRLPAHGCPACDDAMECSCEPPLPMFDEPTAEDRERADALLKAVLSRPGVEL